MTSDEIAGKLADLYDENQIDTQITAFRLGDIINFLFSGTDKDMLNVAVQILERLIISCANDCKQAGMNPKESIKMMRHHVQNMLISMLQHVEETYQDEMIQEAIRDAEAEMNEGQGS